MQVHVNIINVLIVCYGQAFMEHADLGFHWLCQEPTETQEQIWVSSLPNEEKEFDYRWATTENQNSYSWFKAVRLVKSALGRDRALWRENDQSRGMASILAVKKQATNISVSFDTTPNWRVSSE